MRFKRVGPPEWISNGLLGAVVLGCSDPERLGAPSAAQTGMLSFFLHQRTSQVTRVVGTSILSLLGGALLLTGHGWRRSWQYTWRTTVESLRATVKSVGPLTAHKHFVANCREFGAELSRWRGLGTTCRHCTRLVGPCLCAGISNGPQSLALKERCLPRPFSMTLGRVRLKSSGSKPYRP
jgi:hypothetical protein